MPSAAQAVSSRANEGGGGGHMQLSHDNFSTRSVGGGGETNQQGVRQMQARQKNQQGVRRMQQPPHAGGHCCGKRAVAGACRTDRHVTLLPCFCVHKYRAGHTRVLRPLGGRLQAFEVGVKCRGRYLQAQAPEGGGRGGISAGKKWRRSRGGCKARAGEGGGGGAASAGRGRCANHRARTRSCCT